MKQVQISLPTIATIKQFVEVMTLTDADVDLCSGRYVIDAHSTLGILSLDLMKPITLIVHSDDETTVNELMEKLQPFVVE